MFTGLVESLGKVHSVEQDGAGVLLQVALPTGWPDQLSLGDSVAINGCCLTVVGLEGGAAAFQAGPETLAKTNLGQLTPQSPVNLERSLAANARLGGHFVQGHVDGLGIVDEIVQDGEWVTMWFRVARALTSQMVPKGSVTVDGVSLTLVLVEAERFSVALIPHTLAVTTLGQRPVGALVNIETDILGKYVQKFLQGQPVPAGFPSAVV